MAERIDIVDICSGLGLLVLSAPALVELRQHTLELAERDMAADVLSAELAAAHLSTMVVPLGAAIFGWVLVVQGWRGR